jgi:hypothetical protein
VGGGVQLGPLGTAATDRPIVPAPADYDDGKFFGMKLAGEIEVLGENPPQCNFVIKNPTWPDPGSNLGRRGGKPGTNRLSCGAATANIVTPFQEFWKHTHAHTQESDSLKKQFKTRKTVFLPIEHAFPSLKKTID